MAENGSSKVEFAEPLIWVVLILVLFQALSGLGKGLEQKFGIDTTFFSETFQTTKELTEDTPLNTKIKNTGSAELLSEPGGGSVVEEVRLGERGEIVGGPVLIDGEFWWEIEYESGYWS